MKNAIITGATSLIGAGLINKLMENGYHIIAVIRPDSKNILRLPQCDGLQVVALDMENIHTLPNMISENVDLFFHLAWEGAHASSRNNRELQDNNYHCSINAVNTAIRLNCRTFIGAGSQAEYGRLDGKIDETCRTEPLTEYGKAKLKTFRSGVEKAMKMNMCFNWARIFSVYGEYDHPSTLIISCLKKMLRNEEIPLSQCTQNWDYLYVDDAADALVHIGEKGKNGEVYNIASGFSRPLKEFVIEMLDITDSKSKLNFGAIEYGEEGPVSFEPSVEKLKKELKWDPQFDFRSGVERVINYLKEK